jgi:hypothetical protein
VNIKASSHIGGQLLLPVHTVPGYTKEENNQRGIAEDRPIKEITVSGKKQKRREVVVSISRMQ